MRGYAPYSICHWALVRVWMSPFASLGARVFRATLVEGRVAREASARAFGSPLGPLSARFMRRTGLLAVARPGRSTPGRTRVRGTSRGGQTGEEPLRLLIHPRTVRFGLSGLAVRHTVAYEVRDRFGLSATIAPRTAAGAHVNGCARRSA